VPFTGNPPHFHRISTQGFRLVCVLLVCVCGVLPSAAAQDGDAGLFRVFLRDGRVLTSYGEWARVDGRVVFSMPIRRGDPGADLRLITVPEAQVDWPRTEQYAGGLRADRYARTRGDSDFAEVSNAVAVALNSLATVTDPVARLQRVESARQLLLDWPGAAYGYRAVEVREILGLLDDALVDLRAAAGRPASQLALVAPPSLPPNEPLLPEPSESELVEQLLTAADVAPTPAERSSLLQTVIGLIDQAAAALPQAWAMLMRREATGRLAEEAALDAAYTALRTRTLTTAARLGARADVRGLERLRGAVRTADARLGARRADDMAALAEAVERQLVQAQRLQLARDQWVLRQPTVRRYRTAMTPVFRTVSRATPALEDVRAQAGPPAAQLPSMLTRWQGTGKRLAQVEVPSEVAAIHALFRSAWLMGEQALTLRLSAAAANDAARAAQASSAAAGALMLWGRARADLDAMLVRPEMPSAP
jgi:hypothetical protein